MTAVTVITATPHFVSADERKILVGSTPQSFNDIPPVLRHKEENVAVSLDPPLTGFSDEDGAQGTLYVIESDLAFISTTGKGFQIEYPSITLHAVLRSEGGPSIYCQSGESSGEPSNDPQEDMDMRELTIIPQDASEAVKQAQNYSWKTGVFAPL
ncbi:hypothetical protein V5O48_006888 [Marasmius crinis-equi]|uniref:Uncharacterized protein n=1 Tax=Marasmius crinis-equi TaxID=585013 RepID=A0ABR3FI80_9AGAR